jgi:hypothetical protein
MKFADLRKDMTLKGDDNYFYIKRKIGSRVEYVEIKWLDAPIEIKFWRNERMSGQKWDEPRFAEAFAISSKSSLMRYIFKRAQ